MRWPVFAFVLLIVLVAQTTLASRVSIQDIRPDWLFATAVFFGLYAARADAAIAGWLVGFAADLSSIERIGLQSALLCITAVFINSIRDLVFLKNAATHFVVVLAAGLFAQGGVAVYRAWQYDGAAAWRTILTESLAVAAYTALWAVPVYHLLLKGSAVMGLHTSRYSHGRMTHHGARRV